MRFTIAEARTVDIRAPLILSLGTHFKLCQMSRVRHQVTIPSLWRACEILLLLPQGRRRCERQSKESEPRCPRACPEPVEGAAGLIWQPVIPFGVLVMALREQSGTCHSEKTPAVFESVLVYA